MKNVHDLFPNPMDLIAWEKVNNFVKVKVNRCEADVKIILDSKEKDRNVSTIEKSNYLRQVLHFLGNTEFRYKCKMLSPINILD